MTKYVSEEFDITAEEMELEILLEQKKELSAEEVTQAIGLIEIIREKGFEVTHFLANAVECGLTEKLLESEDGVRIFDLLAGDIENINSKDVSKDTALFKAAERDYLKTSEALVSKGANCEIPCHQGDTALIIAAEKNSLRVLEFLIEKGASLNAKEDLMQETALIIAAAKGNTEVVNLLIAKGADANQTNAAGRTALISAATLSGNHETVAMLIDNGANINARDSRGLTALAGAMQHDHDGVVGLLIERGAELELRDLDYAVNLHNPKMFNQVVDNILTKKGAEMSAEERASLREKLEANAHFLSSELSRSASTHGLIDLPNGDSVGLVDASSLQSPQEKGAAK